MAAPRARQRSASSAISSGRRGTFGLRSFVVVPLIAASTMTGSATRPPPEQKLQRVAVWKGRRYRAAATQGKKQEEEGRRGADRARSRPAAAAHGAAPVLRAPDDPEAPGRAHRRRGRGRGLPGRGAPDGRRRVARDRLARPE